MAKKSETRTCVLEAALRSRRKSCRKVGETLATAYKRELEEKTGLHHSFDKPGGGDWGAAPREEGLIPERGKTVTIS